METQEKQNIARSKFNIGFFFLCLGTLVSLITSVVSFLNLVFETLNKKLPDVLTSSYQYGYNTYDFEAIRGFLATLIIFFPIFIAVFFFWKKFAKKGLGQVDEIIRRWMIYIILFLSALVIAIDLVVLVRYFVSGEITARFVYKVLIAFLTAIIIGKYFYVSEFWHKEGVFKKINKYSCPMIGFVLVLMAIIFSFLVMGSPLKQRMLRMDDRRVSDLQSIQSQVINYWQQKEKLPSKLTDLSSPISGWSLPVAPDFQKGEVYEYSIKSEKDLSFELCATFSLPMPKGWREGGYGGGITPMMEKVSLDGVSVPYTGGINESWDHNVGRTCYERTIDKDIYPPYSKIKR